MSKNLPAPDIAGWIGTGLTRPECALAHSSGLVCVPSWSETGGVSIMNARGETRHILAQIPASLGTWLDKGLKPNGIALEAGGSFLLAHLGDERGGIFRLDETGHVEAVVLTVHSEPMPPANYVVADSTGRLWITVSTRKVPRSLDYRQDASTGFIAVCEPGCSDARIVADGLGYTNECVIDEKRGEVYVNETFAQRLTRYCLHEDASLSEREVVVEFGDGTFPDGLALDAEGGLWITSIVSNRVIHITAEREVKRFLEDSDPCHVARAIDAFKQGTMGRSHLDNVKSNALRNVSNLAFGGPGLSRAYLGNLLGDTIPWIDVPVSGAPLPHWNVPLGALEDFATH